MRILINHQTHYDYEDFTRYVIQRLYLTPRDEPGQRVLRWELTGDGEMRQQKDAFGNTVTTLVTTKPRKSISISVVGEVESMASPLDPAKHYQFERVPHEPPVEVFLRPTGLTQANAEMVDFARSRISPTSHERELLALAADIEDRLTYTPGATHVGTTAIDAWARGAGVCQDHAHVMLALCRSAGLPARYVSGYLSGEARASEATHAWVDVWLAGHWLSVDITHRCFTADRWLRLAVGQDYEAVSPVRGVRQGGGAETMRVAVSVCH
ncbi:MAG: hypothetical protein RLZZ80_504 [Pseudomonadota bacterium]